MSRVFFLTFLKPPVVVVSDNKSNSFGAGLPIGSAPTWASLSLLSTASSQMCLFVLVCDGATPSFVFLFAQETSSRHTTSFVVRHSPQTTLPMCSFLRNHKSNTPCTVHSTCSPFQVPGLTFTTQIISSSPLSKQSKCVYFVV